MALPRQNANSIDNAGTPMGGAAQPYNAPGTAPAGPQPPSLSDLYSTPAQAGPGGPIGPAGYPTYQAPDLNSPTQYDQAFQASMGQARSSIQSQLSNALGEINRQQGVAGQMVGSLPGQYDSLYGLATKQATDLGANAEAAQRSAGVQSYTPAGSMEAPFLGAMAMGRATQDAGVPLLQLGVQDQAQRQRMAANQIGADSQNQLGAEERTYLGQQATQERQGQLQNAAAQYGSQSDAYKALTDQYNRQQDYTHQQGLSYQDYLQNKNLYDIRYGYHYPSSPSSFGAQEINSDRGLALAQDPQTNAGQLRASKDYTSILNTLRKNPPKDQASMYATVDKYMKGHSKADTAAASLALYDLYGSQSNPNAAQKPMTLDDLTNPPPLSQFVQNGK